MSERSNKAFKLLVFKSDQKMALRTICVVIFVSIPGNYSCLVAKFHLSRSIGFHMVQSYIPTILIVVISWVSFWMDVDSVPGRTTLGVTTLLTVSSKSAGKPYLPWPCDCMLYHGGLERTEIHKKMPGFDTHIF